MRIDPRKRLRECQEDQIGVSVPAPLNVRLDGLVELANEAGANVNRKELLATLVFAASESGAELQELVRGYRTATAADAVISGQDEARFLDPKEPRSGPRTRRRSL